MITVAEQLSSFLWVVAFMVLPALPGAWALTRMLSGGWPMVLIVSFALSTAAAGLAGLTGWAMGISLFAAGLLVAALVIAADVALLMWLKRSRADRVAVELWPLLAMGTTGIIAVLERPWLSPNMDVFYHLAAARSLMFFGSAVVTDPFYGQGSLTADPTSGAMHLLLGLTAKASGHDVAFLWAGLNVLAAVLVPAAFWALFRQLKVPARPAVIATFAIPLLAFQADFRFAAYPNRLGQSLLVLAIVAFAAIVSSRASGNRAGWVLASLAAFAAAATHTGIAIAVLAFAGTVGIGLGVYVLVARRHPGTHEPARPARRFSLRAVWIAVALQVVFVATAMLPRVWYLLRAGRTDSLASDSGASAGVLSTYTLLGRRIMFYPQNAFSGGDVMLLLGTALAIVCLAAALRRRDPLFALAGIIGLAPVVVGFNPLITPALLAFSPYATFRLLDLTWFAPYVVMPVAWKLNRPLARVALVGALLAAMPALHNQFTEDPPVTIRSGIQNISIAAGWKRDFTQMAGRDTLDALDKQFDGTWPTVATDELTGYGLAGLLDVHVVAVPQIHAPSFMERTGAGGRRRRAMTALLGPTTSNDRRAALVGETGADYVLLWPNRVAENARLDLIRDTETFDVVYNRGGVVLLKVRNGL